MALLGVKRGVGMRLPSCIIIAKVALAWQCVRPANITCHHIPSILPCSKRTQECTIDFWTYISLRSNLQFCQSRDIKIVDCPHQDPQNLHFPNSPAVNIQLSIWSPHVLFVRTEQLFANAVAFEAPDWRIGSSHRHTK